MKRLTFLMLVFVLALPAQKKEDLLSIQRDVADLQDRINKLQHSQDEKLAAMEALLQQAVDAQVKMQSGLSAFERDVTAKLNDQQQKLVQPMASMGSKVDQMSDSFSTVAASVADLQRQLRAQDSKLSDISNAIRTLSTPPPTPAPAVTQAPAAPQISAETLLENAQRDYSKGNLDLALTEYAEYVQKFPNTADAPKAAYYIGYIYYNNQQWDSAAQAFEAVDKMPESLHYTSDALYYKGVSLMKNGQKTEAGQAFKDYIRRYPHGDHVASAHQNRVALGLEPRASAASSKKRD